MTAGRSASRACASPTGTSRRSGGSTSRSRAGEIFAFLGPNGAGKTTTVEILEGYRERSAGEVSVLGADPPKADRAWRERVGIVLQECRLTPELTVREAVAQYAGYYPSPRDVDETVGLVGLAEKADVADLEALGRPAAPPRRRPGAGRRSRAALPGRADDRLRPLRPAPGLGGDRQPARPRQDDLPHDPLHGRGPGARRPRRDHRRRPDRRRGRARRARGTGAARTAGSASGCPTGVANGDLPAPFDAAARPVDGLVSHASARPGARACGR